MAGDNVQRLTQAKIRDTGPANYGEPPRVIGCEEVGETELFRQLISKKKSKINRGIIVLSTNIVVWTQSYQIIRTDFFGLK
jgi:hypothetical protein